MKAPFSFRPYKSAAKPHLKFVVIGKLGGKRMKKFFRTQTEAKTYAHLRNTETMQYGSEAVIPTWLRVMAQRCQERLALRKKTIEDATEYYVAFLEQNERSCTIETLCSELVAEKRQSGFTRQYICTLKVATRRLVEFFGNNLVSAISIRDIETFLRQFTHLSAVTRNFYRQLCVIVFSYGEKHGYCSTNVAAKSAIVKEIQSPVGILQPTELARLLALCPPKIFAAVAIGAFAGLRTAEVCRLDWREIDLWREEKDGVCGYIEVTAANAKSARRRLVKILPCLAAWLRPLARPRGPVTTGPIRYIVLRTEAAQRAGLPKWPRNALRHSYASYHISHFDNADALASQMGHTTNKLIFSNYREVVRPEKAKEYWQLAPFSRPELATIFAFTSEAYPWHVSVNSLTSGEWLDGITNLARYFGVAREGVYYWFNHIPECPPRPADDRFHIPTWREFVKKHTRTKPSSDSGFGLPFYASWYCPFGNEGRKYFGSKAEAKEYANSRNREALAKELNFETIPNVVEFTPKKLRAADTAQLPPPLQTIENANISG